VLEANPVAQAVIDLVGRGGAWHGTAGELLDRITPDPRPRDWPRTARGLSGQLARLAPALEANCITVERPPTRGARRTITLRANREWDEGDCQKRETTDATDATDAARP